MELNKRKMTKKEKGILPSRKDGKPITESQDSAIRTSLGQTLKEFEWQKTRRWYEPGESFGEFLIRYQSNLVTDYVFELVDME